MTSLPHKGPVPRTRPAPVELQQPRKRKKALKQALRDHDPEAARLLLAHSVALGHGRLGIRRYLAARYLGVADLDRFRPFCVDAARRLKPQALLAAAVGIANDLHVAVDVHGVLSELTIPGTAFVLPYGDIHPRIGRGPQYCGAQVSLIGRLEIGDDAWFGSGAVVRGDGHYVVIGDDFRIGKGSTVHISHDLYPVIIGHRVTAGSNAVIHACTVGDDCVIEDGAVVLDGAVLEPGVVVEAGAVVFPRSRLESGWLYAGRPATPVRELAVGERDGRRQHVSDALFASIVAGYDRPPVGVAELGQGAFLAETADVRGMVRIGDRSGVFFGCWLDGADAGIDVGADCNVQDNCVIDASDGPVSIGTETTIGHNVDLPSCRIGNRSLIGIGSVLATGTVVDDDVLLAGGATTLPGQHLYGGWLWGGCPARPIARLDDAKRAMILGTVEHYRTYGDRYRTAQQARVSKEG